MRKPSQMTENNPKLIVKNDGLFANFVFENNILFDNQKYFYSKFGIYNKDRIPDNLFVSGNFDLENLRTSFYEITGKEKLSNDDVIFIEKESLQSLIDIKNSLLRTLLRFLTILLLLMIIALMQQILGNGIWLLTPSLHT